MRQVFTAIVIVLVVDIYFVGVEGQDMDCKEVKRKMMETQIDAMTNCTKHMDFKSASERMEKSACIIRCVLTNSGVLNPDGFFNKGMLEKKMEERYSGATAAMKAKAKELIGNCVNEHGPKFNPADPLCKSYEPFVMCFKDAMNQICP